MKTCSIGASQSLDLKDAPSLVILNQWMLTQPGLHLRKHSNRPRKPDHQKPCTSIGETGELGKTVYMSASLHGLLKLPGLSSLGAWPLTVLRTLSPTSQKSESQLAERYAGLTSPSPTCHGLPRRRHPAVANLLTSSRSHPGEHLVRGTGARPVANLLTSSTFTPGAVSFVGLPRAAEPRRNPHRRKPICRDHQ